MDDKSKVIMELEEHLSNLPDREPPPYLKQRIMASLPPLKKSLWQRLGSGMGDLLQGYRQPLFGAAAMASLLITFYGGMQFQEIQQSTVLAQEAGPVVSETSNANVSFFLGRSLLASGRPKAALVAFKQAELQQPQNPKYVMWQAASFYALGDMGKERMSYRQLIRRRPDYVPARLNLAHNLLEGGQFEEAEQLYEQVLEHDPAEETALYNRGLTLHLQGKTEAEIGAWKRFLKHYRTGVKAYRAMQYLHNKEDYSYRSYQLGYRKIIVNQDVLLGDLGVDRDAEIRYLSAQFARQPESELNLVVFRQNNEKLAKELALELYRKITKQLPLGNQKKVTISWFGEAESIQGAGDASIQLPEGLLVFSNPGLIQKGERI